MPHSLPTTDPVNSLAQAMVMSSDTPLLLLDDQLVVVVASVSFCRAFDLDCDAITGGSIFAMGKGEWDLPRLRSFLGAVVSGGAVIDTYEIDLDAGEGQGKRCLELSAHKLAYIDQSNVRILLSVADRTDARAAARENTQLVADKVLLVQELQHRVANSLQIIASVLMQSARRVSSEETRDHLHKAHNRVLSVASIQKQLASTGANEVSLKPYFDQLCTSIAASMIPDPDTLRIRVDVDDTVVGSDASVSLGLMVTELVINALKHAYPDDKGGLIKVCFESDDGGWSLYVDDDGVGMPTNPKNAPAGLGTSIVEALARQLQARITIAPAHPGTSVAIIHKTVEAAGADVLPLVRAV